MWESRFSFRKFAIYAGPSLLMSAAFMDPGNLEGDLQLGVETGYTLLWVTALSTFMGFVVQILTAKLGTVTGKDLAEHCRDEYPPIVRYLVWIMVELAIIGADIQEVIGSAIAISILSQGTIPLWAGTIIAVVTSFGLLFLDVMGPRVLEGFFGIMVTTMAVSFVYMYTRADVPESEVIKGFITPRIKMENIDTAVALFGSVIMPFNIYLHSGLVQSRRIDRTNLKETKDAVGYFWLESFLVVLVTLVVNTSVVCVFASGYHGSSHTKAINVGLMDAGQLLAERFGVEMRYVWAIGLMASGQSAVMAGGMAGQFVMSGFLDLKWSKWKRLIYSRSIAIIPTVLVVLLYKDSHKLDAMNQVLNILQSLILPFALLPLLVFTGSQRIMGPLVNSKFMNVGSWMIGVWVLLLNFSALFGDVKKNCTPSAGSILECTSWCLGVVVYFGLVLYVFLHPYFNGNPQQQPSEQPLLANEAFNTNEDNNNVSVARDPVPL